MTATTIDRAQPSATPAGSASTNGPVLLRMDGVTKVFTTEEVETHALSGVHLDVKKGEFVSITGPSGCGKTTLLSILGLLDSPSGGSYWLDSKAVHELSAAERAAVRNRQIGFIFQSFNLIGDLTVSENVELPLTYRGMAADERRKRVQNALERVNMLHRVNHLPSQLSGGQQQRVAVARAGGRSSHPAGRRADRKPRLEEWRGRDGSAARSPPQRLHDLHGDARSSLRSARGSRRSPVRRPGR